MRTEDGQIIYRCLNGDAAAFGLLVDKYRASIHALAYSKLRNFHDAEDVTQEAFLKAYRKLRTLRWWDNFLAWLYAITSNLCKDWARSQSRRPDREFVADQSLDILSDPSMDSYRVGLVRESLQEALNSLPEKYHQVLMLYYLGGLSRSEISRFLGISLRTITQRLTMGRAKLKEEMIEMMNETYQQQRLTGAFTLRVMEMVKRMKIQSVPRMPWLQWGIPIAIGITLAFLSFTSFLVPLNPAHIVAGELPQPRLDTRRSRSIDYGSELPVHLYAPVALAASPDSNNLSGISTADGGYGQAYESEQSSLKSSALLGVPDNQEKVTVSGKVLKDDVPVFNAQVFIRAPGTGQEKALEYEGKTHGDGSFQIEIPEPEKWELLNHDGSKRKLLVAIAQHPQYSFGWAKFSRDDIADLTIRLHNPASITATVVGKSGDPIQGANVQMEVVSFVESDDPRPGFIFRDAIPNRVVRTDSRGRFELHGLPEISNVALNITAPGHAQMGEASVRAGTEGYTFSLNEEGRIEGRVTFGDTGEPVKGVEITVQAIYGGMASAQTDENGNYALTGLATGNYNIMSIKQLPPGWVMEPMGYLTAIEGMVVKVDLPLVKSGFVTGRVIDKDTGEPIRGHYINLVQGGSIISGAISDGDGFYHLQAVPGEAAVYSRKPRGYESVEPKPSRAVQKHVNVIEGETTSGVDFQFGKPNLLALTGRVIVSDGTPVAGAVISDGLERLRHYVTSDEDGSFTMAELPVGLELSIEAEQTELQLRAYVDVEVRAGVEVKIVMEKYETKDVSGRVMDWDGKPVPNASIRLTRYDRDLRRGPASSVGMTDSSGEYIIKGLIIGDEYQVSAGMKGLKQFSTRLWTDTKIFRMEPDTARLKDIVFFAGVPLPGGSD